MDPRADIVADLDLALAALRRVIVRAIDGHLVDPLATAPVAKKAEKRDLTPREAPAPKPPKLSKAQAPDPKAPPSVEAHGVHVDYATNTITHAGKSVQVARREAQAIAALARAKPDIVSRPELMRRAWPDLTENSGWTRLSDFCSHMPAILADVDLRLHVERGIGIGLQGKE